MLKHIISGFTVLTFLIVWLTLTSCAPTSIPVSSQASPTAGSRSFTPAATLVVNLQPTPTSLPAPQPTVIAESKINEVCPVSKVVKNIGNNKFKPILSPIRHDTNPYLFDLATKSKIDLPFSEGNAIDELQISPDGQWIAYFVIPGNQNTAESLLIVANIHGDIVYKKTVNRLKDWYLIDTWLDNETLIMERYRTLPNSATFATPLPVTLLNPFKGSIKNLDFSFPGLVYLEPVVLWDLFGYSATAYHPSLDLVVYARESPDLRESFVLWSLELKKEITNIQAPIGFGRGPVWSPDGSQFLVDSLTRIPQPRNWTEAERLSEELFSVDQSGKLTRLTHLTESFKEVSIEGYVWSPDGNHIAFDVLVNGGKNSSATVTGSRLAILDLHTKQVTMYCLRPYPEATRLFWLPDGHQILMGVENTENNKLSANTRIYDTVLMDINENKMTILSEDTIPLGWMTKEP